MELKAQIQECLKAFAVTDLRPASTGLLNTLGYKSEKTLEIDSTPGAFIAEFDKRDRKFRKNKALFDCWKSIEFLFQITDDEIKESGGQAGFDFETGFNANDYQSYLFFALDLKKGKYTRTQFADITREINLLFDMPALLLIRHNGSLTFSIIDRRLHKKDQSRDVLEKVKLIKDIRYQEPHRAHIEILHDLSLSSLVVKHECRNFRQLHEAWRKTLDTNELNKRFYRELADWYFWALNHVEFPSDVENDEATRNATNVIRLLTRLIFCWFLKEKGLIPSNLFNKGKLAVVLKSMKDDDSTFYLAILQNLFFGTLNQRMNTSDQENRKFTSDGSFDDRKKEYGIKNLYRYQKLFAVDEKDAIELFSDIPFLNGGLFDCLDKEDDSGKVIYVDGFTRNPRKQPKVPNFLFYSEERTLDLSDAYGDKKRAKEKVRGLINLLDSYKFTITENTPIEEEIALDPELLGKVFENLLASYNPETGTTARKQTGSFYTPREIVNYMVEESLIVYLEGQLRAKVPKLAKMKDLQDLLREVFAYTEKDHPFSEEEVEALIDAIDASKILDPACGSGAFPMGILHKLVFILGKLDPNNERWKQKQLNKLDSVSMREELERTFRDNDDDYGRKLFLIEQCIYGVDIQPIAIQISKLRFFISLICDQRTNKNKALNCGISPLPNLETKFVAANTLLSLERRQDQGVLTDERLLKLEKELSIVRHKHFAAQRRRDKIGLQQRDGELREEIAAVLADNGMSGDTSHKIAVWDPYDQNTSASFFDPEWMFGLSDGFDVVIGNPPYVRQEKIKDLKPVLKHYNCFSGTADLYVYFFERGFSVLKESGVLTYISSNKYFRAGYGQKLRQYFGNNGKIERLIDFGDAPVFTAISYPSIIIIQKTVPDNNSLRAFTWVPGPPIEDFAQISASNGFLMPQTDLSIKGWQLENQITMRLLDKLRQAGIPLGEYVNGRFYYGIKSGYNEAFVVDRATCDRLIAEHPSSAEVLKPFLRGRDVKRWVVEFADQYLIKIESSENKKHPWSDQPTDKAEVTFAKTYPAIYRRFQQHRASLITRQDQGKYYWELRSCKYWQEFEEPKIILGRFMNKATFAFDKQSYFHNDALYMIAGSTEYVVAIMNSCPSWWFLSHICTDLQNGYLQAFRENLFQIPVPNATTEQKSAIVSLVSSILTTKQANPTASVSDLEAEIDQLVYQLYGLTEAEIAAIESKI